MIRNIHFADPGEPAPTTNPLPVEREEVTLRLRKVTVSPQEEYQLRAGEVRPISYELAAAILSFKGRCEINNKGVVVDRKELGGRHVYFHEDSITLNDFSVREQRLFYVINRQASDVIHILDHAGCYIESLPLREKPAVLDNDAQRQQYRENKAIADRAAKRLQDLHAEDTRERLETLAHNSREMTRIVQTLPTPGSDHAQPLQAHRSESAEIVAEVTRQTIARSSREKEAGTAADIVSRRTRQVDCPL